MNDVNRISGYNVLSVLGHGANSTIYAVQAPRDSQVYALKRVIRSGPEDQRFVDQAVNEYRVCSQIDHPAVRKCYKLIRKRKFLQTSEVFLLMQLVEGMNLQQERPASLLKLCEIFIEVSDALHVMHMASIVHADIKPNNILMTDSGQVIIIDFGQSCPTGTVKNRIQGTPDYIAPEQVKRRALTAQTDVYNFGATMYWCLTEKHAPTLIPKQGTEIAHAGQLDLVEPDKLNPDVPLGLNKLVLDCLKTKPRDRPESMAEVKSRLGIVVHKLKLENPKAETAKPSLDKKKKKKKVEQVNDHLNDSAIFKNVPVVDHRDSLDDSDIMDSRDN